MSNQYPIVLAHGIARFDYLTDSFLRRNNLILWDLGRAFDRLHYFRGIRSHLSDHGIDSYATSVPFAADVEDRARALVDEVKRVLSVSGQPKVHIIGHSMGGLDSRHMIVRHQMADQVASLTTIGTPHLGTSFANWGLTHGGELLIHSLAPYADLAGFLNLTHEACGKFNQDFVDREVANSVVYQTYASSQEPPEVFRPLHASWQIIFEAEGPNDGLVSAQSQRWTDKLAASDGQTKPIRQHEFPFSADHLNQIGWWNVEQLSRLQWWRIDIFREKRQFEDGVKALYLEIAREVRAL